MTRSGMRVLVPAPPLTASFFLSSFSPFPPGQLQPVCRQRGHGRDRDCAAGTSHQVRLRAQERVSSPSAAPSHRRCPFSFFLALPFHFFVSPALSKTLRRATRPSLRFVLPSSSLSISKAAPAPPRERSISCRAAATARTSLRRRCRAAQGVRRAIVARCTVRSVASRWFLASRRVQPSQLCSLNPSCTPGMMRAMRAMRVIIGANASSRCLFFSSVAALRARLDRNGRWLAPKPKPHPPVKRCPTPTHLPACIHTSRAVEPSPHSRPGPD